METAVLGFVGSKNIGEELKLSEIAHIFGLSEGRISQILSHSVLSLRSHFQSLK